MSCKQTRAARPLQIEPLFSAVDQITCAGNLSHKNVAFGALTVCPGVCSSPRVGVWAPSYRGIFVFLFSRRWRPSRRKVSARSLTASLFPQTPPGDMKNPSFGTTAPSLTVSGDVILSNQFSPDDEPFAEYLWMEHEEEFNRQVRCGGGGGGMSWDVRDEASRSIWSFVCSTCWTKEGVLESWGRKQLFYHSTSHWYYFTY